MGIFTMKKLIGVMFALVVIAGCSSTQTDDSGTVGGGADDAGLATASGVGEDSGIGSDTMDDAAASIPTIFYFEFDQSTLTAETRAALDAHATRLRNANSAVRLEGHADERGTREYNLALGERRAKAIANYLALQGVSRSQVEAISYGEERPASLGQNEQAWGQNRRVEIK